MAEARKTTGKTTGDDVRKDMMVRKDKAAAMGVPELAVDDDNPDRLLKVKEIAAQLRIGGAAVIKKIKSGEIPAGNVGSALHAQYRVRVADLRAYEINAGLRSPLSED